MSDYVSTVEQTILRQDAEIARLRAVIKQIAETPCNCFGPNYRGSFERHEDEEGHYWNCDTHGVGVRLAREEVARWEK